MAEALALVVGLLTLLALRRTPDPIYIPHGSPLGHVAALLWLFGPFTMPLFAFVQSTVQAPLQAINTLVELGALHWLFNGVLLWVGASWLAMQLASSPFGKRAQTVALPLVLAMLPVTTVAVAYLSARLPFLRGLWLLILLSSLFTAGLLMGDNTPAHYPTRPYSARWLKAAGCAALVLAHTFPLQLVLQLPARAWTPTLGAVWTLAEAPQPGALGAVLLLYSVWAAAGAWMLARQKNREDAVAPPLQIFPTLRR
jgi:hypothetical protein